MNWFVIMIEAISMAIIFTIVVFISSKNKHTPAGIHNYPKDIQEEYFKTHEKVEVGYKSKKVIITKSIGILMFVLFFAGCALLAGAKTFINGFVVGLILMAWIGIYDTFFIDWILFANLKCFRLEGTEHMDKAYHQKWFHLKGILFLGSVYMVIVAAMVGLIVMIF